MIPSSDRDRGSARASGRRSKVSAFIRELRRRRVFRVAAVYFAVAFVLVETSDLVFPALEIPSWAYTLVVVLAIMGFPIAMVLAWAFDLTPEGVHRTEPLPGTADSAPQSAAPRDPAPSGVRPPTPSAARPPRPPGGPSIAILPFTNLSGNPEDEYFSDGVTEDIMARVCSVPGLRVISRTSVMRYKGATTPIPEIVGELGVAYVMEGTVRRTPERVRIVVQLVDGATDLNLWVETYDRKVEDVFAIQSEVAARVADALETELSTRDRTRLARTPTRSLAAYDLYLRGRHEWNRRTPRALERSLEHLERALVLDPDFALAHAAMADSLVTLGVYGAAAPGEVMEQARSAAEEALTRDPSLAEAMTARACVRALHDWNWSGAESDFRRGIELDPQYPTARQWYAMNLLVPRKRFEEARIQLDFALELDPLSPVLEVSTGILRFYQRDWPAAERTLRDLLEREPDFAVARYFLGLVLAHSSRADEARPELVETVQRMSGAGEAAAALAMVQAMTGDRDGALATLAGLQERRERSYVSPVLLAQVRAALGEQDRAMELLAEALEERAAALAWLDLRPALDPLRDREDFHRIRDAVMTDGAASLSSSSA